MLVALVPTASASSSPVRRAKVSGEAAWPSQSRPPYDAPIRRVAEKLMPGLGSHAAGLTTPASDIHVAVVFKGESFRSKHRNDPSRGGHGQFGANKRRTCDEGSLEDQKDLSNDHKRFLDSIGNAGVTFDVFGLTYACGNGLDYASRLKDMYGPNMKGFDIISKSHSTQLATMAQSLRMALTTGKQYSGIYMMRWDYRYAAIGSRMNTSACWTDPTPRNLVSFETGNNADAMLYIPGADVKDMLAFMEMDDSSCCGGSMPASEQNKRANKCAQACPNCVSNYLQHKGAHVTSDSCHPCAGVGCNAERLAKLDEVDEDVDPDLGVDAEWCKPNPLTMG